MSLPAAAEDEPAENYYQLAKKAYDANKCKKATTYFEKYLAIPNVSADRAESAKSAISWCEGKLSIESVLKSSLKGVFNGVKN